MSCPHDRNNHYCHGVMIKIIIIQKYSQHSHFVFVFLSVWQDSSWLSTCISLAIDSLWERMSPRLSVPSTFLSNTHSNTNIYEKESKFFCSTFSQLFYVMTLSYIPNLSHSLFFIEIFTAEWWRQEALQTRCSRPR